jgi:hypothetical protein
LFRLPCRWCTHVVGLVCVLMVCWFLSFVLYVAVPVVLFRESVLLTVNFLKYSDIWLSVPVFVPFISYFCSFYICDVFPIRLSLFLLYFLVTCSCYVCIYIYMFNVWLENPELLIISYHHLVGEGHYHW